MQNVRREPHLKGPRRGGNAAHIHRTSRILAWRSCSGLFTKPDVGGRGDGFGYPACLRHPKAKFGMGSHKGHVSFFDRTGNISDVATELPRIGSDVVVLELQRQSGTGPAVVWKEFKVRRRKVEAALRWLCHHSPAYSEVVISEANLSTLPADGQIQAMIVPVDDDPEDVDAGPADQRGPAGVAAAAPNSEIEATHSGTVVGGQVRAHDVGAAASDAHDALRERVRPAAHATAPVVPTAPVDHPAPTFRQPHARFVSYKECPNFFAKAWPTLFMPGHLHAAPEPATAAEFALPNRVRTTADIPAEFSRQGRSRHHTIDFFQWARHLMHAADGR
jgi:hypothetical protein